MVIAVPLSARERRMHEGVFAEDSRVASSLRDDELDADRHGGERASEVSTDRVDYLSRRAVDRRVVHARPLLVVRVEDDIDALHVAKVRREVRDAQIVVRPYRTLDRLARVNAVVTHLQTVGREAIEDRLRDD